MQSGPSNVWSGTLCIARTDLTLGCWCCKKSGLSYFSLSTTQFRAACIHRRFAHQEVVLKHQIDISAVSPCHLRWHCSTGIILMAPRPRPRPHPQLGVLTRPDACTPHIGPTSLRAAINIQIFPSHDFQRSVFATAPNPCSKINNQSKCTCRRYLPAIRHLDEIDVLAMCITLRGSCVISPHLFPGIHIHDT